MHSTCLYEHIKELGLLDRFRMNFKMNRIRTNIDMGKKG